MPGFNISFYLTDEKVPVYLKRQEEIKEKVKKLINDEIKE